jgi:ATP-binding cassette, subfamily F, member 3
LNKDKAAAELAMADPALFADKQKFQEVETNYKQINQQLAELNKQYELLFEQMMHD